MLHKYQAPNLADDGWVLLDELILNHIADGVYWVILDTREQKNIARRKLINGEWEYTKRSSVDGNSGSVVYIMIDNAFD